MSGSTGHSRLALAYPEAGDAAANLPPGLHYYRSGF
jgi:hypothetical protein